MNFKDFVETAWAVKPVLLTTATNGLSAETDRLLAVAWKPADSKITRTIYRDTNLEPLNKAQKYHGISNEMMMTEGLDEDLFKEQLEEIFEENTVVFTYNTAFQLSFLQQITDKPVKVYDLSVIDQALTNGLTFDTEEIASFNGFYGACASRYYPMKVANILKRYKLTRETAPGQLPLEKMLEVLSCVYHAVSDLEIQLLPS